MHAQHLVLHTWRHCVLSASNAQSTLQCWYQDYHVLVITESLSNVCLHSFKVLLLVLQNVKLQAHKLIPEWPNFLSQEIIYPIDPTLIQNKYFGGLGCFVCTACSSILQYYCLVLQINCLHSISTNHTRMHHNRSEMKNNKSNQRQNKYISTLMLLWYRFVLHIGTT